MDLTKESDIISLDHPDQCHRRVPEQEEGNAQNRAEKEVECRHGGQGPCRQWQADMRVLCLCSQTARIHHHMLAS